MFQKWQKTKRREPTIATAEEDMDEKKPQRGLTDPDYPLLGHEAKGAPKYQATNAKIPVEITKMLYRQMLLWIAMLISPFIFGIGLISYLISYWVQYYSMIWYHKRPSEIRDHFAAKGLVGDFYFTFLIANGIAFVPFLLFATLPANPACGPLRSAECAAGFAANNLTSCTVDALNNRRNFAWLVDTLLPPDEFIASGVFGLASANATGLSLETAPGCDGQCWADRFKQVFDILISTEVLIPAVMVFVVAVAFVSAVWTRNARELKEARKELAIEYKDKKMMARYARVEV